MKFDRNLFGRKWVGYALAGCVTVLFYMIISHLHVFGGVVRKIGGYVNPVFIGIVMAYVMDPVVGFFSRQVFIRVNNPRLRRNLSVICTAITVILFIVILLVALIPQVIESIITFLRNLDTYATSLQRLLRSLSSHSSDEESAIDLSGLISSGSSLLSHLTSSLPKNVENVFFTSVNIGRNAVMLGIDFILAIYFLVDKNRLLGVSTRLLRAILPERIYTRAGVFWHRCNSILLQYIAFDLLDGVIVGVANFVFMLLLKLPYNTLISVVVGVTNLAPTFGPIVGCILGAFVLLLVNPWYALWFVIFTIILQTVDGYIIKPRLFGGQLGVPAVWILIAIIVGGRMFGVVGILLSIPAAAIIDFMFKEGLLPLLERRRVRADARMNARDKQTSDIEKED